MKEYFVQDNKINQFQEFNAENLTLVKDNLKYSKFIQKQKLYFEKKEKNENLMC